MELMNTTTAKLDNGKTLVIDITRERATTLFEEIKTNNAKGINLYFDNCERILELRNKNAHYLFEYGSFKEMAEALFEKGETQAKNMCTIAERYGSKLQDGSCVIMHREELSQYNATQLYYISQLNGFTNIVDTPKKYSISPNTTCAEIRKIVSDEKRLIQLRKLGLTDKQIDETLAKEKAEKDAPKDAPKDKISIDADKLAKAIKTIMSIENALKSDNTPNVKIDKINAIIDKYNK